MAWRNRVEVSYGALRQNVAAIRAAAAPRSVIAVVKADAYGLGLERCARIYHEAGVGAMACATIGEADKIRRVAPECRIIVLGSPLPEERPAAIASGYEPCLSTIDEVHEFAQQANPHAPLPVHVNVDTGMGRFGALLELLHGFGIDAGDVGQAGGRYRRQPDQETRRARKQNDLFHHLPPLGLKGPSLPSSRNCRSASMLTVKSSI